MEVSYGFPVVVEKSLIADGGAVNRIIGGNRKIFMPPSAGGLDLGSDKIFNRAVLVEKRALLAKCS